MVAYNFQARFADAVERRIKRQTIRAWGKRRHAQKGEALQLYTGQRTTACRLLANEICESSQSILILPRDRVVITHSGRIWETIYGLEVFARLDGFNSVDEFFEFFGRDGCEVFRGCLIRW